MRSDPNAQGSRAERVGALSLLVGFLDRNMRQFHPAVRDFIGIAIVVVVSVYVVNGLLLPTYIRGQILVNGAPAQGIQVVHAESTPMTSNEFGWWMLPVSHGGFPSNIHLDFRNQNQKSCYIGSVDIRGPWPVWSAFFPMDYVLRVDSDKCPSEIKVVHIADARSAHELTTVLAQSQKAPRRSDASAVMLAIDSVRVYNLPGLFRSSGRIYLKFFLDGQRIPDADLLEPGFPFPLESQMEAWLPVRQKEEERFKGFQANISSLTQRDPRGDSLDIPRGKLVVQVLADTGESLGSVDLAPLFGEAEPVGPVRLKSQSPTGVDLDLSLKTSPGSYTREEKPKATAYVYLKEGQSGFKRPTLYVGTGELIASKPCCSAVAVARLSRGRYVFLSLPVGSDILCIEKTSQEHCIALSAEPSEQFYLRAALSVGKGRFVLNRATEEETRKDIKSMRFVDEAMVLDGGYVKRSDATFR